MTRLGHCAICSPLGRIVSITTLQRNHWRRHNPPNLHTVGSNCFYDGRRPFSFSAFVVVGELAYNNVLCDRRATRSHAHTMLLLLSRHMHSSVLTLVSANQQQRRGRCNRRRRRADCTSSRYTADDDVFCTCSETIRGARRKWLSRCF